MRTFQEKIETAAATRLGVPPGRPAREELARFKAFLKVESHRLKLLHRSGAGGQPVCQARAALLDVVVRRLWEVAKATLSPAAQQEFPPLALVATGGYGRAELNPYSDVDLMFLHDGQVVAGRIPLPHLNKVTDGILYPLWDLGFKVGHSVRSVSDCVKVANTDLQSKTALIEARLITGDAKLFHKFERTLLEKCVAGWEEDYIAARIADQEARHAKFGNSAYLQEPNIKNGCGGLRDFQNLLWMAHFKYRTRTLADLEQREMMSSAERLQLEAAYDFLLRARNELHYQGSRAGDVVTRNLQPAIAYQLGYTDRSPSRRLEKFMGGLYGHLRNVYLITTTLEQRLALLPKPRRLPSLRALLGRRPAEDSAAPVDGFKFAGRYVVATSNRVFADAPRRLMRVFLQAQQRGLKLHPDLAQLVRQNVHLVRREFLHDPHVHETFLEILNQRGNVAPVLRTMHEVGLLGKYLPEFGRLTARVQHEFYHQYTVDEHTLVCLEKLDQIWEAKTEPYSRYSGILQELERPFVLYLAMLLHDAGKAKGDGEHADAGSRLALRVAKRLRLDAGTTRTLRWIIENHVVMAQISQRRDLSDPQVIRSFANLVQTPETLAILTLHTFADSQATSANFWTSFKDLLLWSLFQQTRQVLRGDTSFVRSEARVRESLLADVLRTVPDHISDEEVRAHFANLPARYFQIHLAPEILEDLILAHLFMHLQLAEGEKPLEPVVTWQNAPDRGNTTVKICTWDRPGLFSKIAASFSASDLNILSAQIFSRGDGIALDTFFVTDAKTGAMVTKEERQRFEETLTRTLSSGGVDLPRLIASARLAKPLYQSLDGESIPLRIAFDNSISSHWTVLDLEAEDRVGLLYAISHAIAELDLDIAVAKIVTEKGAAIDSFYVAEKNGDKILAPARQEVITRRIGEAVAALDRRD